MDSGYLVIIGAIIGASGGIVSQTITAIFASKRESRKIKSDRQIALDERFFPLRLEKYGILLSTAREIDLSLSRVDRELLGQDVKFMNTLMHQLNDLPAKQAELDLISPSTSAAVAAVVDNLITRRNERFWRIGTGTRPERLKQLGEDFPGVLKECEARMRAEIGLPTIMS